MPASGEIEIPRVNSAHQSLGTKAGEERREHRLEEATTTDRATVIPQQGALKSGGSLGRGWTALHHGFKRQPRGVHPGRRPFLGPADGDIKIGPEIARLEI